MNEPDSAPASLRPASRSSAALALLLLVPAPTVGVLAAMWFLSGTAGQVVYLFSKVWIAALPALWHLGVDGGTLEWPRPRPASSVVGVALGAILAGTIVGAYYAVGREWIDVEVFRDAAARNGLDAPGHYLGLAVYICTFNALIEEYVWRWFVFRKCEVLVPAYVAVLLSALFFTAHHVFALAAQMPWSVTLLGSTGVFAGGVVWSWCYLRYRSIWPGFFSHVVVDIAIFWVGWRLLFG